MNIKGTIKVIGQTKEFGSNGFKKREVVITTDEQYPQDILIEFVQDKCTILDKYNVGQQVEIGINLRGREWVNPQGETKYFNSIQGWKISKAEDNQQSEIQNPPKTNAPDLNAEDQDDLPF